MRAATEPLCQWSCFTGRWQQLTPFGCFHPPSTEKSNMSSSIQSNTFMAESTIQHHSLVTRTEQIYNQLFLRHLLKKKRFHPLTCFCNRARDNKKDQKTWFIFIYETSKFKKRWWKHWIANTLTESTYRKLLVLCKESLVQQYKKYQNPHAPGFVWSTGSCRVQLTDCCWHKRYTLGSTLKLLKGGNLKHPQPLQYMHPFPPPPPCFTFSFT